MYIKCCACKDCVGSVAFGWTRLPGIRGMMDFKKNKNILIKVTVKSLVTKVRLKCENLEDVLYKLWFLSLWYLS